MQPSADPAAGRLDRGPCAGLSGGPASLHCGHRCQHHGVGCCPVPKERGQGAGGVLLQQGPEPCREELLHDQVGVADGPGIAARHTQELVPLYTDRCTSKTLRARWSYRGTTSRSIREVSNTDALSQHSCASMECWYCQRQEDRWANQTGSGEG